MSRTSTIMLTSTAPSAPTIGPTTSTSGNRMPSPSLQRTPCTKAGRSITRTSAPTTRKLSNKHLPNPVRLAVNGWRRPVAPPALPSQGNRNAIRNNSQQGHPPSTFSNPPSSRRVASKSKGATKRHLQLIHKSLADVVPSSKVRPAHENSGGMRITQGVPRIPKIVHPASQCGVRHVPTTVRNLQCQPLAHETNAIAKRRRQCAKFQRQFPFNTSSGEIFIANHSNIANRLSLVSHSRSEPHQYPVKRRAPCQRNRNSRRNPKPSRNVNHHPRRRQYGKCRATSHVRHRRPITTGTATRQTIAVANEANASVLQPVCVDTAAGKFVRNLTPSVQATGSTAWRAALLESRKENPCNLQGQLRVIKLCFS